MHLLAMSMGEATLSEWVQMVIRRLPITKSLSESYRLSNMTRCRHDPETPEPPGSDHQ